VSNHIVYIVCLLAGCVVYFSPLSTLAALTLQSDHPSGELRGHAVPQQPLDPHQRGNTVFRGWPGLVHSPSLGAAQDGDEER
jgi:hypothetical protein